MLGHGASVGTMLEVRDMAGSEGIDVPAVYDVRRVKPLDVDVLHEILGKYEALAVIEENYMPGGIGEAVGAIIAEGGYRVKLLRFGVPDVCVKHATQTEQREMYGLDTRSVIERYKAYLRNEE